MLENLEIVIAMLEKVGMAALIVLAYRLIRRARFSIVRSSLAIGLLFGFGAVVAMANPLEVVPGVILDIRTAMVALAALFGGPLAALIASALTIAMRVNIGGAGALAGCVAIALAAVIGLVYARLSGGRRDPIGLAILGLLLSLSLVAGVFAPVPLVSSTTPALIIRNLLGTMILGYLLAMEDRREAEYRAYKREAERDPLTGLKNRRALEAFDRQVAAEAERHPFAVLMIDIDGFKSLNDIHGHAFGDRVLRRLAEVVRGRMRGFDLVVRYGGEEFCVVVKEATLHNAQRIAEDIRLQIMEERFQAVTEEVTVTVSIGVAEANASALSVFQVIEHADKALYDAKNSGRNRVCTYQPETDRRQKTRSA
ncbi:diguanylate cyclase [Martelella mediterranea]|uniref:GGDEF domain-containing protein n=1 Tax=Martelella mediterranea TaxID=293089 RepID=UPI001E30C517|nr:diguanylate cyclase [Martelella mediterranea]MCD1632433.1 diguanylate cyclase [Martelella mediterranea]